MPQVPNPMSEASLIGSTRLNLLPYPRSVSLRGASFHPAPSNYLYVSGAATALMRRRCFLMTKRLEEAGFRTIMQTSDRLQSGQAFFTVAATMPKLEGMEKTLHGPAAAREGYRMVVTTDGVFIQAADEQGMQNAGATLKQLLQDGPDIPGMVIEDYPLLAWRVMHWDFKGWAPSVEYMKFALSILADLKINAVILEYESYFNYPSQPGLASPGALTKPELEDIELFAQDLGISIIPLVPCLGNANYVLRLPEYAALREHPQYYQIYSPVMAESLGVVTAMMEDLCSVHQSKFLHIGGDESRLLGINPETAERAKQLGGRSALYLDYIGKVVRFLLSENRHPLIWDDSFRKMTDEQVRWLPPEAILTFWQYEGHDGHVTPTILSNLDRYKRLGRTVWGAATRSPAQRYDAFDNIDAWTEAAEMGYLEGLITTAWTRDHTLGGLYQPTEAAWPSTFYAAERVWSGLKGLPREHFSNRFTARMFGMKEGASQHRLWAAFDLMLRDHPRRAREYFIQEMKNAPRNRQTLAFLESWCALGGFKEYVKHFEDEISANFCNLQADRGDPFNCGRLRWRVQEAKGRLPPLIANFQAQAQRITVPGQIEEFLESAIAYNLRRLDEMEILLGSYPLPPKEWQQNVQM